jgi:hypothetical protein
MSEWWIFEHEELARLKYFPSQVQHTNIKQLRFSQCYQDCYTAVTWFPRPSLCKRGTVLGRESSVHRLAIVEVASCGLLPRGKTRTCSQEHTCCINVYRNALERVSSGEFLLALWDTVVPVIHVYSHVVLEMVKKINKNCALLGHYAASSGKKNYQYLSRDDPVERNC